MADIFMDVDTALSEVPVNLMPLIDDTDFKSREESVTYDQAGMDLLWNFVTTAGAFTQTAVTPTTGGVYDWTNQGNGMYTIEIPASGGASINNDTEGFGWFTGYATGILPWRGPVIGFRAAGLNDKLMDSAYSTTRGLAGTALPDAAADAAGGLPISDAGSLDLDTKLANTNEVTAARMGALTDLIDGGRLDLILDNILTDTGTTLDGKIDTIDGVADTILVDTNELQTNQGNWITATGFSTHSAADVKTALEANGSKLDHLWETTEDDVGVRRFTANALEQAPDTDNSLDAAGIRSAVGLTSANLDTQLSGIDGKIDTVDTVADSILEDTNELQTNQGNWITATGFSTHSAADVKTAIEAAGSKVTQILEDTGTTIPATLTTIEGKVDTVDTVVDGIAADYSTFDPTTDEVDLGKINGTTITGDGSTGNEFDV